MNIVTILGARPQFIKAAALSRKILGYDKINEVIIHTGQHYDHKMSRVFFEELEIPLPELNFSTGGKSHGEMTGLQLIKIEKALTIYKPDLVLVYGDTNSTLAGALSAAKLNIPVAHIEAGLRSFNKKMPEEINRVIADHISDILFVPTTTAMKNLRNEHLHEKIHLVGDIMYDATKYYASTAKKNSKILNELSLKHREYSLVTIHRQENTEDYDNLKNIVQGLVNLSTTEKLVFPIHPRTAKKLLEFDLLEYVKSNLIAIDPVGYLDMISLEKHANIVITDSGGMQKESYFNDVKCIVIRSETEWTELVDNKCSFLLPANEVSDRLSELYKKVVAENSNIPENIYGNGNTARQILDVILSKYN